MMHAATLGGKATNPKSVKTSAKKNKVTLKKGSRFKLKASVTKASSKLRLTTYRSLKYESRNPGIAAVIFKGVITGKKAGKTQIYVYAQNGVYKRINVTVK